MSEEKNKKTSKELYKEVKKEASWARALGNQWYSGLKQEGQLHIYTDGIRSNCAVFLAKQNKWIEGPKNIASAIDNKEKLFEAVESFFKTAPLNKCKGYSVIIHSGKETSISTLKVSYETTEERDHEIVNNTKTVLSLSDSKDESYYTWRYMPVGLESKGGANYVLSSDLKVVNGQKTVTKQPSGNKPIFWGYYTASTEIVSLFPILLANPWVNEEQAKSDTSLVTIKDADGNEKEEEVKNEVDVNLMVFNYTNHTFIVPVNSEGEIHEVQITTIKHIHSPTPKDLSEKLANWITQSDAEQPRITIYAMGSATVEEITSELDEEVFDDFGDMKIDLAVGQPLDNMSHLFAKLSSHTVESENIRPEFFAFNPNNFTQFYTKKDRIPETVQDLKISIPNQNFAEVSGGDIKKSAIITCLLTQLSIIVMVLGLIAYLGINGFSAYKVIKTDYWKLSTAEVASVQLQKENWEIDKNTFKLWETALTPRSKGWEHIELLKTIVPQGSGIITEKFDYKIENSDVQGKKSNKNLNRKWTISGKCTKKASSYLENLRKSSSLQEFFKEFGIEKQLDTFKPSSEGKGKVTRPITVDALQMERVVSSNDEYTFKFSLIIKQDITKKDVYHF